MYILSIYTKAKNLTYRCTYMDCISTYVTVNHYRNTIIAQSVRPSPPVRPSVSPCNDIRSHRQHCSNGIHRMLSLMSPLSRSFDAGVNASSANRSQSCELLDYIHYHSRITR